MTSTQAGLVAPYLDPARKHDFAFIFDVRDGNPNGDPDAGGMPRVDPETMRGLVTDVAIKRKIRNMISTFSKGEEGYDIYVETGVSLNHQHERAYETLKLKRGDSSAIDQARDWMCETFYDVRMFGAVMTTGKDENGKKGAKASCGRVQGPVQITFSRSVDQVFAQEHAITRITQTRQEDIDKGESTEMGSKHAVHYGLYIGYGHFSAPHAASTRVNSKDLEKFWQALRDMFEHDRASSRGEIAMRGLYVFSHPNGYGTAHAHKLFDLIDITRKSEEPARDFSDYTITIDTDRLPSDITLNALIDS